MSDELERARIQAQDLKSRITSLSLPLTGGGIGFETDESERKVVRDVIVALEDRRALYIDFNLEIESQVVSSILETRDELTDAIKRVADGTPAADSFRRMRAECR